MWIALGILSALLLLLCARVTAYVKWSGEAEVWVRYLFIRLKVYPREDKPKKPEKPPKTSKKAEPGEKRKKAEPRVLSDTVGMVLDLAQSAGVGLRILLRDLRVSDLDLKVTVAKEDAAETATECGRMNAYLHGACAALRNCIRIRDASIDVRPDFLSDSGDFSISFYASLTPLRVLGAALCVGAAFLLRAARRAGSKPPEEKPQAQARQPAAKP